MSSKLPSPGDHNDYIQAEPRRQKPLSARVEPVATVLGDMPLRIPSYQRPYTWTVKNVDQLVRDIQKFRIAGQYRIGTFIINRFDSTAPHAGGEPGLEAAATLDIVDGQQRYLSFALIARALLSRSQHLSEHLVRELESSSRAIVVPQREDGRSNHNLLVNFRHLVSLFSHWLAEELDDFTEFFLRDCTVVVLEVDDLDSAFQMFDSQNTRGRPLFPTDLLKAYHLREFCLTAASKEHVLSTVQRWEAIAPKEIDHLISQILFPIKLWSVNHELPPKGFGPENLDLFKGIREGDHGVVQFRWAQPMLLAKASVDRFCEENSTLISHGVIPELKFPFQITQPVIDGEMFFRLVGHYVQEGRRLGALGSVDTPAGSDPAMDAILNEVRNQPGGTGNRYIRGLFDCFLMAYVDRFGWHRIGDAGRVFAQQAYVLRVELTRVHLRSIDNHARGVHGNLGQSYDNLFAKMADALDPNVILDLPLPAFKKDNLPPLSLENIYGQESHA